MYDRKKQQLKKKILSRLKDKLKKNSCASLYVDVKTRPINFWQYHEKHHVATSFSNIFPLINTIEVRSKQRSFPLPFLDQEYSALNHAIVEYDSTKQELAGLKSIHQSLLAKSINEDDACNKAIFSPIINPSEVLLNNQGFSGRVICSNEFSFFSSDEIFATGEEWNQIYETVTLLIHETNNKLRLWKKAINFHKSNIKLLTNNCISNFFICHPHRINKTFPGSGKVEEEIEKHSVINANSIIFLQKINLKNDKKSKTALP